ncbi:MAG: hypothetical protein GY926_19410 [bacterium]|nr:hypothetical protein [bacterium]
MWTSKLGLTAKPLILGLTQSGVLVNFSTLTGPGGSGAPQLRLRTECDRQVNAVSFDMVIYVDPGIPAQYNAQRIWVPGDFASLRATTYFGEVDAQLDTGKDVSFPDGGYFTIKFLGSLE